MTKADREIFKNAPIKEAIIEVAFNPLSDDYLAALESLEKKLAKYPNKKPLHIHELKFKVPEPSQPVSEQSLQSTLAGFQFWASDEKELYSARLQGFAFHRLKPYTQWEDVLPKFLEGWQFFNEVIKDFSPVVAVVRNINLIEIPELNFDLNDYLEGGFSLPNGVDGPVEEFFSRVTIDFPETHSKCNVTTAKQPRTGEKDTKTSVVLDIESVHPLKSRLSVDQLSEILTNLNETKDRVFHGTVTDKAKELFR